MDVYADLEIGLHRRDANTYSVELRYSRSDSDTEIRQISKEQPVFYSDLHALSESVFESVIYGQKLGEIIFADRHIRTGVERVLSDVEKESASLRFRLFIGPSAPELNDLRWETLRIPDQDRYLSIGEDTLFSRYLSSSDWRSISLRPRTSLRVLAAIANPHGLATIGMASVDMNAELNLIRRSLGSEFDLVELAEPGTVTLSNIQGCLRDGFDILYLAAHGSLHQGKSLLLLEDDDGSISWTQGDEFVQYLSELKVRPCLVILSSCQSAGEGKAEIESGATVMASLGPSLAQIGIPAVLAMQGDVQMETMSRFMPVVFRELLRDGQIDRAVSIARGTIRDADDWWAPALFMRLKRGRIWYTGGFDQNDHGLEQWPSILGSIEDEECTPIIGIGLFESLLGSRQQIAQRWADNYHYPMAPHDREDLPQVAQFLQTVQSRRTLQRELASHLSQSIYDQICREHSSATADGVDFDLNTISAADGPDELINTLRQVRQKRQLVESHHIFARLPFRVFVTTDPTNLLANALEEVGKTPQIEICRWNQDLERRKPIFGGERDYDPDLEPTVERPLVFQLFGNITVRESLVLTEDDYFEYLIGATKNNELIPPVVRDAIADSALVFLGFRIDSWDFRVLFRSIMKQHGRRARFDDAHVAAQVDLEDGRIAEPDRAREFLKRYFGANNVNIYWGNAVDFVKELDLRLAARE